MPPTSPEPLSSDALIPFLPAPSRTPIEGAGYVTEARLESLRLDGAAFDLSEA